MTDQNPNPLIQDRAMDTIDFCQQALTAVQFGLEMKAGDDRVLTSEEAFGLHLLIEGVRAALRHAGAQTQEHYYREAGEQ
jgi:hypothetical protein